MMVVFELLLNYFVDWVDDGGFMKSGMMSSKVSMSRYVCLLACLPLFN